MSGTCVQATAEAVTSWRFLASSVGCLRASLALG